MSKTKPTYEELEAILDALPDIVMKMDANKVYTWANPAGLAFFGDDVLGKEASFYFVGEQDTYEAVEPLFRGDEGVFYVESWQRRRDGEKRLLAWWCRTLKDAEGNVTGAVSTARDITEREEARRTIESLSLFLSEDPYPVLRIAEDGAVLHANEMAELLLGDRGSGTGQRAPAEWLEVVTEAMRSDSEGRFEVERDGRTFAFRVVPITAAGYANFYGRDITERKKVQGELARTLAGLEERVQERTAELARANEELDSFAYAVAHDLRAPLRAIWGFSRALAEDCAESVGPTGAHYIDRIVGNCEEMTQLIDGLLMLSRLSRQEIRLEPVDLSALAAAVVETLRDAEPGREVEIAIADGLVAEGDRQLLRAVLQNLLENAWKFTAGESPARIEFGVTEAGGSAAYFVRDNGAGFDMTYASRLFSPFQRLHRSDEFPGSGIGLTTVRRIIHRLGGRVWAEGQVGRGATFYFTL